MDRIRQRVQLFSSLRASQRALARCMHPARVQSVRSHGRDLLIRLQAVSDLANEQKPDDPEAAGRADAVEAAIGEVDGLLAEQLASTVEVIESLEFDQLRAMGPRLCVNHPEEVGALIDVMLKGDLQQDKLVRLVEYLVTMLCSEEWSGRRTIVREPADASAGLRDLAREMLASDEAAAEAAEATLAAAEASLIHGNDLRATRDEIREFKKGLGRQILHPRVLSAAISYNAAMWNQVAAQVDTSVGVDQLAEDLLSSLEESGPTGEKATEAECGLRYAEGFQRVVKGFGQRLAGEKVEDDAVARVVSRMEIDGLRPAEVAAFQAESPTPLQSQVRDAVVVGCAVRQLHEISDALEALDIDATMLEEQALGEVMNDMNATARRLFADSRYSEAFELSEVRTRNLASLSSTRRPLLVQEEIDDAPAKRRFRWLDAGLPLGLSWQVMGPILGLVVVGYFLSTLGNGNISTLSASQLAAISPFLESGHHRVHEGEPRFVGELGPAWDYLGTSERRAMASNIAAHFEAEGIGTTILLGPGPRVMAAWEKGELGTLVPKPPDPTGATPDSK